MKNKELVIQLMEKIETTRNHYQAIHSAMYFARNNGYYSDTVFSADLTRALVDIELGLWRQVFMFGMTLNDKEQERIKAAAYQRFLADGISVKDYLPGGANAGSWLVSDEEEFREMCKKLFVPK
jgi:hypothetical protein